MKWCCRYLLLAPSAEGNGTGRPRRGAIHGPSGGLNCFQPSDSAACLTCRRTMRVSLCTRSGVVAHRLPCLFCRWSGSLVPPRGESWRLCGSLVLPGVFPCRWIFSFQGSEGAVAFRCDTPSLSSRKNRGVHTQICEYSQKVHKLYSVLEDQHKSLYSTPEKSVG